VSASVQGRREKIRAGGQRNRAGPWQQILTIGILHFNFFKGFSPGKKFRQAEVGFESLLFQGVVFWTEIFIFHKWGEGKRI